MSDGEQPEFRRLIGIESIEGQGHTFSIEASAQECQALATRFGVLSIESLVARGTLVQGTDGSRVGLRARLEAEVVQQCVISLETVTQRIDVDFSRVYDRDMDSEWANLDNSGDEIFLSLDSDDLAEPIVGGYIDIGETVAEQLALELDPFPRTSGAKLDGLALSRGQADQGSEQANPLAALAAIKGKLKKGR